MLNTYTISLILIKALLACWQLLQITVCWICYDRIISGFEVERTARMDFLQRRHAAQKKDQMEDFKTNNGILLRNLLPGHVAEHFMGCGKIVSQMSNTRKTYSPAVPDCLFWNARRVCYNIYGAFTAHFTARVKKLNTLILCAFFDTAWHHCPHVTKPQFGDVFSMTFNEWRHKRLELK